VEVPWSSFGSLFRERRQDDGPIPVAHRWVPARSPLAFPQVDAAPYAWPFDGPAHPQRTALVCIDWQTDSCGPGGYVDAMGYDIDLTRAGLLPTAEVPAVARAAGLTVVTPGKAMSRGLLTVRRTSCGVRSGLGLVWVIPDRADASWSEASPAGRSSPR